MKTRWWWGVAAPVVVVVAGALVATAMILARPEVRTQPPKKSVPLVRVLTARPESVRLTVKAQGTVEPRTQSTLVPEVAGRVVWVSDSFVDGGFFEKGEPLVTVDHRDYELAVIRAKARVADARVALEREKEEARVARREWEQLGEGEPNPLTVHEPQLSQARAALEAAQADLDQAKLQLERTTLRAPYAGRVLEKKADVGQYVTPGTPLAEIYSVDYAEIRLPIPDRELAYLDVPIRYRGEAATAAGPEVILTAAFAGARHRWKGRIVRTEGELDPKSRMVHVVARVVNPYGRGSKRDRPPLAVGMYVEAEILGRRVSNVVVLPRAALRDGNRVLVVDGENRLRFRDVDVLKADRERVILRSGVAAGERVCLLPLEAAVDGMRVRTP